jgi:hypothetical protein
MRLQLALSIGCMNNFIATALYTRALKPEHYILTTDEKSFSPFETTLRITPLICIALMRQDK